MLNVQRQGISATDVFQAKGIMSDHGSSCKICSSCAVQSWFFDGNISVEQEPDNDQCLYSEKKGIGRRCLLHVWSLLYMHCNKCDSWKCHGVVALVAIEEQKRVQSRGHHWHWSQGASPSSTILAPPRLSALYSVSFFLSSFHST